MNIKKILTAYGTLIFFVLFCMAISIIEPRFLALNNILNVFRQTSINAIIAAGMTLVILTGGIDLSVGSIFALSSVIGALSLINGLGTAPSILMALAAGAGLGMLNALFVVSFKMQAFIATLVTMTLARGLTYIITDGIPATIPSTAPATASFYYLGEGYILGIPFPVVLTFTLYAILFWILHKTKYGRHLYAVGGNEKAALTAGIRIGKIKFWVYTASGAAAAFSGLVLTARLGSAPPTGGMGYELDAIAAVVLGGTSLSGGKGAILKSVMGALIIAILGNALNLLNVSSYYQMVVKALVILLAVLTTRE